MHNRANATLANANETGKHDEKNLVERHEFASSDYSDDQNTAARPFFDCRLLKRCRLELSSCSGA